MLQAKEGGRRPARRFTVFRSLSVSGFTLGGAEPAPYGRNSALLQRRGSATPDGGFPLVKRSFYLVYHSFC